MHNAADRHPAANALNQVPLTCPGRPVFYAIAISLCSFVQSAYATCYSVYKENVLIFQSIIAPVDMSMFLSETISAKYRAGAEMVFSDGINQCAGIDTSRIIQLEKT